MYSINFTHPLKSINSCSKNGWSKIVCACAIWVIRVHGKCKNKKAVVVLVLVQKKNGNSGGTRNFSHLIVLKSTVWNLSHLKPTNTNRHQKST